MTRTTALCLLLLCGSLWAAPRLVPWPRSVAEGKGHLALSAKSRIVAAGPRLLPLAEVLSDEVRTAVGLSLEAAAGEARAGDIVLTLDPSLEGEAYRLSVTDRVAVAAGTYAGAAAGTATLLQAVVERDAAAVVPRLTIDDRPQAACRGLLVDVARRPHPVEVIEQCIVLCRLYKIRYLQLHLTDSQSFVFPSTAYPRLTTNNRNGIAAYTLDELRSLVSFADARGVTLVPEFETPGHSGAMVRAMPEVFGYKDPKTGKHRGLGVLNLANEAIYGPLDTLVGEMCDVFRSSPYFHIGCDEVWLANLAKTPEAKARVKKLGFQNCHDLYLHHILRMNESVRKRGKQTIVWEGFHGDGSASVKIPKDILVMPFENTYNPATVLARHGYTMVNTAWTPLYVVNQVRQEPEHIYAWDLLRFGRYPRGGYARTQWVQLESTPLIIGAQMCAWEQRDWLEIPSLRSRLPAMAERIWNPDAARSFDDFHGRWQATDRLLDRLILPVAIRADGLLHPDPDRRADTPTIGRPTDPYLFAQAATVHLSLLRPRRLGETIRYTLDGSEPIPRSPEYTGPFQITKEETRRGGNPNYPPKMEATVRARLFAGDRPVGYTRTQFYRYHWIAALPRKVKLTMYETPEGMARLPDDLSALRKAHASLEPWMNLRALPHAARPAHYAAVYEGTIDVPADADLEFKLRSHGGTSQLAIDGTLVCDRVASDWGETLGRRRLAKGRHAIRLVYCGRGDFMSLARRAAGGKKWEDLNGWLVPLP